MRQTVNDHGTPAPVRYCVVWDSTGVAIGDARRAVRTLLARAGHPADERTSQDAQLVVSELVTNAVRHAPGDGGLLLELTPDAGVLTVTVRDSSSSAPEQRPHDAGRVGGHGMHLVTRLCEQVRTVALADGKQVMARIVLDRTR
ncbi:ATP-binding protein [Streptomyces longwoodensis]|uniref:ATP-binding protein n=1 Tax=Streptomyces longwoodensis TaxID=68231 RepID=UPI00224FD6A5|nr:ATP-binding protein [Streptomyces longwoodensis]MCX5000306.1 ATP-binding protein [Streptomyces longwoodensis]